MINFEDLKKQILLQGLNEDDFAHLSSLLVYKRYKKDEIIFKTGEPPEGIYLITKGRVRISTIIHRGHQKTLVIFKEGNYFGDISTLEKRPHSSTAVALTNVEAYLLSFSNLECGSTKNLSLSCKIIKKLALISSKNLRHMNIKYYKLEESF